MRLLSRLFLLGAMMVLTSLSVVRPASAADEVKAKFGQTVIGQAAPDFKAVDVDGKDVKLSEFKGKTLLLSFCNEAGPRDALLKIHGDFHEQGLVLLAVFSGAKKEAFASWVSKYTPIEGLTAAWDGASRTAPESIAGGRYGLGVIPATAVLDREGKIVGGFVGFGSQSPAYVTALLVKAGLKAPAETPPAPGEGSAAALPDPLPVGTVAPDFTGVNRDGRPVKLSDYAGKIVVLDFWATWCGPCLASLPHTEKIAAATKDRDVVVLASCTNDTREAFEEWLKKKQPDYPTILFSHDPAGESEERVSKKVYQVQGIPTQFVIGRDGKIAAVIVGYSESDPQLQDALTALGVKF